MQDLGFGKLITTDDRERDAIHVACVPVEAIQRLAPGTQVVFIDEAKNYGQVRKRAIGEEHVGIIDPFLRCDVERGERCWMFLLPNTVTSLRHEWTHPAFEEKPITAEDREIAERVAKKLDGRYQRAQGWMRQFAEEADLTYDEALKAGQDYLANGDIYVQQGGQAQDHFYTHHEEYWDSYEVITNTKVPASIRGDSIFSCQC